MEPGNDIDLAEKILEIISNSETLKKMGELSEEQSKQYDIHVSTTRLEELYRKVLNK